MKQEENDTISKISDGIKLYKSKDIQFKELRYIINNALREFDYLILSKIPPTQRPCVVCGIYALDYKNNRAIDYMVHDKIWAEAGFKKDQIACITCLEEKLGRSLVLEDFTNAFCNAMVRWAFSKKV